MECSGRSQSAGSDPSPPLEALCPGVLWSVAARKSTVLLRKRRDAVIGDGASIVEDCRVCNRDICQTQDRKRDADQVFHLNSLSFCRAACPALHPGTKLSWALGHDLICEYLVAVHQKRLTIFLNLIQEDLFSMLQLLHYLLPIVLKPA